MAALQCDICGGKLIGKPGGLFECEYCGMEYNTDWAKAKIQEIKGTVKVEGTVEVKGTVKVEGEVSAENLLERARIALENGSWHDAGTYFDRVLDYDAKCTEAYLGKCCARFACRDIHEAIRNKRTQILDNEAFNNALRFMDPAAAQALRTEVETAQKEHAEQKRQRKEQEQAQKEQYRMRAEENRQIQEKLRRERWVQARRIAQELKGVLSLGSVHGVCLKPDGTVVAEGRKQDEKCDVQSWRDVMCVAAGAQCTVGIQTDGTVLCTGDPRIAEEVRSWNNLRAVAVTQGRPLVVGLSDSGKVLASSEWVSLYRNGRSYDEERLHKKEAVRQWDNIASICCGWHNVLGFHPDGTLEMASDESEEFFAEESQLRYWDNIVSASSDMSHAVGIKNDGTVVACGSNKYGQCDVSEWKDIVDVATSTNTTFGLKLNGKVIIAGKESDYYGVKDWKNIVAIFHGGALYGIKADGTIEVCGPEGIYSFADEVKLFDDAAAFVQERDIQRKMRKQLAAERKAQAIAQRKAELKKEQNGLNEKLGNLKGFLAALQRKRIESRLEEIQTELEELK